MLQLLLVEEIPVSEEEVQAWLDSIPNLSASTFRRESYRKAYNVEEKIRRLKVSKQANLNCFVGLPNSETIKD